MLARIIDNLKNELRNDLDFFKREMTRKVQFLQIELSDAKIEIAELREKNSDLEKRVELLENQNETQDLKIDHLEKTLEENVIESEMKKISIETRKSFDAPENFGLNDEELKTLSKYG